MTALHHAAASGCARTLLAWAIINTFTHCSNAEFVVQLIKAGLPLEAQGAANMSSRVVY